MVKKLMNMSSLMAVVALAATIAGCGPEAKKIKLGEIQDITQETMRADGLKNVLISTDGKLAYVLNAVGEVYNVNIEQGIQSLHDKSKWKLMTLADDSKPGTAGKAKLDLLETTPERSRQIILTSKGVLVKAWFGIGAIAYFEGANQVPTYAWTSEAAHQVTAAPLNTNHPFLQVVVVMHDGKEYAVVQSDAVSSVELADGAKFNGKHGYASTPRSEYIGGMKMVATKGSTAAEPGKLFFVDAKGVSFITLDKLGTDADAAVVDAKADSKHWGRDTTFVTKAVDYGAGNVTAGRALGVNGRDVAGKTGIQNDSVLSATLFNGKIYISLDVAAHMLKQFTGGIAVYDIASGESKAANEFWAGQAGITLQEHNGKLFGVYRTQFVELNADTAVPANVVFSPWVAQKNQLTPSKVLLGKDLADVMYEGLSSGFSAMTFIGNQGDMIGMGQYSAFTIHFHDKDIELKENKEE